MVGCELFEISMPLEQAEAALAESSQVAEFLARCRELARYCTQNGWIDNESIEFDIQQRAAHQVLVAVKFTEVIMKGAGCEGRRMPCFARLLLSVNGRGEVVSATSA